MGDNEWMDGIEKRLDALEAGRSRSADNVGLIMGRLGTLEKADNRRQFDIGQMGDDQSYDAARIEKRLDVLEGDYGNTEPEPDTVVVPGAVLREMRYMAQKLEDLCSENIPLEEMPLVHEELNPDAGSPSAISKELDRVTGRERDEL